MSDKRISELTAASALDGLEKLPIVQSGSTVSTTTQDIADLAASGNIGDSDLSISDNTRVLTLAGALSTDSFKIRNSASQDIISFRGDKGVYIPSGTIGLGTTPVSGIKQMVSSSGDIYGVHTSGSFSVSNFVADTTSTRGFYARRVANNGAGFYGESTISSGSNIMYDSNVSSTGTANTTVFRLRAPISGAYTPDTLIGADVQFLNAATKNIGVRIDCDNATTENTALHIVSGDVKMPSGNVGLTETLTFNGSASGDVLTLTIENGVITGKTVVP